MALVACRECSREVSSEAKTCPHCGIGDPAPIGLDENTQLDSSGANENLELKANVLVSDVDTEAKLETPCTEILPVGRSVNCIACGESISANSFKCPKCGEFLPCISPKRLLIQLVVILSTLFIIAGVVYAAMYGDRLGEKNLEHSQADNKEDFMRKLTLTRKEKGIICRAYISTAYGRSINIIKHYKTDNAGLAYVRYYRNDGNKFEYVCEVKPSSIVYSMRDQSVNDWGRWRFDEAATYTLKGKMLTINDPMKGKKEFELP